MLFSNLAMNERMCRTASSCNSNRRKRPEEGDLVECYSMRVIIGIVQRYTDNIGTRKKESEIAYYDMSVVNWPDYI